MVIRVVDAEGLVKGNTPRGRELGLAWILGSGFEPQHLKKEKKKRKSNVSFSINNVSLVKGLPATWYLLYIFYHNNQTNLTAVNFDASIEMLISFILFNPKLLFLEC